MRHDAAIHIPDQGLEADSGEWLAVHRSFFARTPHAPGCCEATLRGEKTTVKRLWLSPAINSKYPNAF